MNWLSRFLHIKPANKTLCFHIGRGKVRQDLVRLLRDWQRFGIRDVTFDRATNTVNARVDKNNRKYTSSSFSNLLFSQWRFEDWRCEVEVLEVEQILRCNAAFFLSLYHILTFKLLTPLHRSQDQASLFRDRTFRRSRARSTCQSLPRTLHADSRCRFKLQKSRRYRRRCLPSPLHVDRGPREAGGHDGGPGLGDLRSR
jgi:hypothetical protein